MADAPKNLTEAQVALMSSLPRIRKQATAQYGKYADLADVSRQLLPILGELGLAFTARPTWVQRADGRSEFVLAYALKHVSGEKEEGEYPLPSGTPQTMGGAITYARRYALCAITGAVADGDDDAEEAEAAHYATRPPLTRQRRVQRTRGPQPGDDPWASVNGNGERQEQGTLPGPEVHDGGLTTDIVRHFKRLGLGADHDREERLGMTMVLAGIDRIIDSTSDLTQDEGRRVRNKLERCKNEMALRELVAAEQSARKPAEVPDGT